MKAKLWTLVVCLPAFAMQLSAATLQVGPGKTYAKPCAAFAAAADGDVILIDAAGNYNGDVCLMYANNLTIRGVNGRPHINAAGQSARDKGIWVLEGDNTVIENVELSGAVSTSRNGAAVRLEGVGVTLRQVYFHNNQDGILANGVQAGEVLIEYSEFANNGAGDGQSHNIYIGRVNKFTLQYSYSHAAIGGHLVKSRAANNYILFNRLSSEGANTSYEVDLPNGGLSYIVGNVIQQGPNDPNHILISYLAEGMNPFNASQDLFVVNNTLVNEEPFGTFIQLVGSANPATVANNIFAGAGKLVNGPSGILSNNLSGVDPMFVNPSAYDYHLQAGSPAIDAGTYPGTRLGMSLLPRYEYVHKSCGEVRNSAAAIDIGAFEFGGAGTALACGSSTTIAALSALSVAPSSVVGGSATATLTVSLTNAAPAGGVTVLLSSSNGSAASTASSITIPAGSYSASTTVDTGAVTAATPVTITGSYDGITKSITLDVNPSPLPAIPTALSNVTASLSSILGGQTLRLTVTLSSIAPAGGVVVNLQTSDPTLAAVTSSVTVPAGAISVSTMVATQPVTAARGVTVAATLNGITKSDYIILNSMLNSVSLSAASLTGGRSATLTVTLNEAAPTGGIYVALNSSAPAAANTPAYVFVPAGATSAQVTVPTFRVSASTPVTLSASYASAVRSDTLTVN